VKPSYLIQREMVLRALILLVAGVCGLAGMAVEFGFPITPWRDHVASGLSLSAIVLFLLELGLAWRQRSSTPVFLRRRWPGLTMAVLIVVQLIVALTVGPGFWPDSAPSWLSPTSLTEIFLVVAQFFVAGFLLVNLPRLHSRFALLKIRPGLAFQLVFLTVILTGAGLLLLPEATPGDSPIGPLDALFTATSAVCVTGLVVRDTATEFTRFGQVVILVMIQLGGLGIMSLTAALALLLGRGIGVRESSLMREVFQVPVLQEVGQILRFVLALTVISEAVGAMMLYSSLEGMVRDPGERLFTAVFHSVSAFCNAGFSTYGDSLMSWTDAPLAMVTIMALLIIGGLGFMVVLNLLRSLRALGRDVPRSQRPRIHLGTKVVLRWTAGLLVLGTGGLVLLEWQGAMADLTWGDRLLQALFQSATCRTAGFNSLDLTTLGPAALFLMILLMFVGGGSGSTAGGVKISTLAVLVADFKAIAAGRRQARLGNREIDESDRHRAAVVLTLALVVAAGGVLVLLITESAGMLPIVFEVVSALGTVGLSLNLTPELSLAGRVVVILLMFLGRIGVLTIAYALVKPQRDATVRLPRGSMMIG